MSEQAGLSNRRATPASKGIYWILHIPVELLFLLHRNRRHFHSPSRQASAAQPYRLGFDRKLERARRAPACRVARHRAFLRFVRVKEAQAQRKVSALLPGGSRS